MVARPGQACHHARVRGIGVIRGAQHVGAALLGAPVTPPPGPAPSCRHTAPSRLTLLGGAAKRRHNLGSAVAALCRLVDTWGAEAVESAIVEALRADSPHVAAVRQVLEQRAQDSSMPPPMAVHLPDDARVRDLHVTPHALDGYDLKETV